MALYSPSTTIRPSTELFDVAAQIEFAPRETYDPIETSLYFRREIPPRHQSLCLAADGFERLHEVSLFQFAGVIAGH
jgi:hypothetical protein